MSDIEKIKKLRQSTGAGFKDCNAALKESNGDLEKAAEILRVKGIAKASKKMSRDAKEGVIVISGDANKTSLIEVNCETDFVAKTEGFIDLTHNLAMQIAATNPIALDRESIPESVSSREKEIYADQASTSGKPENIIEKMVDGKMNKFFQENCLMEQAYIKDSEKKVSELLTESIATLGENITISRYVRFAVGESDISNEKI